MLDLSATNLVNIAQIRGTSANDTITGSPGSDNIAAGDGNDVIYESGGSDTIDGGTGTNSFIGKSASTSYTPLLHTASGVAVFNNGTNWEFADSKGAVITLSNIESVQFTNETLSSSNSNSSIVSPEGLGFMGSPAHSALKASNLTSSHEKAFGAGVELADFQTQVSKTVAQTSFANLGVKSTEAFLHSIENGIHSFVTSVLDK